MEELKDIKPPLELPFLSYFVYWGAIVIFTLICIYALFYLFKKYYHNVGKNSEINPLKRLKTLDMSSSKEFAYSVTHYGKLVLDSKEKEEIFNELKIDLEKYKYQKRVEPLDEKSKEIFYKFIKQLEL